MGVLNCFSDRCKCVSTVTLVLLCIVFIIAGALLYLNGFEKLHGVTFDGAPYLPEYKYDYSSFTFYIQYASFSSVGVLIFGLVSAQCKKPYTVLVYILAAVGAGMLMIYSSGITSEFK